MKTYRLKGLLMNEGWKSNVFIQVDDQGLISSISTSNADKKIEEIQAYAIPGFQNAHSHAFQYAMAGLAERHSTESTPDDFWSWRESMYQLALRINPDQLQAIATMLYSEMLRHGYTNVAEFHYVHHDKDGKPYANLSEMGERLVLAAKEAGIGITLIPIWYQKGGFGKEPTEGQKRFISKDEDRYLDLLEASEKSCAFYDHANIAMGMHSMRGVAPEAIKQVAEIGRKDIPFHIHVSEQLKEIEDALAYLGRRPVEWLLENLTISDRYHLVHATHLTADEIRGIAKCKANVVLCPSTEGNLGDGIFPLKAFQEAGGQWSIGTDSHVGLNPLEELRILDYGQRLVSHKRNTFYSSEEGDGGMYAIRMALEAGRKAMNNYHPSFFEVGQKFNAMLFRADHPLIASTSLENLTSTLVYSSDSSMHYGTISNGKLVVKEGKHYRSEKIGQDFMQTIQSLKNR